MGPLPGTAPYMGRFGAQQQSAPGQEWSEQQMTRYVQAFMESCPAKTAMAGFAGFALGGMFGLFMSSMRYDTPMSSALPGAPGAAISELPWRQQLRHGLTDMGKASYSSARNFGTVGAVFSGTECIIEGLRAKNELSNGVAAGCITGGILARKSGPQAVALGCGGFAAFSAAIDWYMRQPSDTGVGRVD
ncbi:MAG: hypothetical protein Q9162_003368 [Coniocarpon cinnabarinum]